MNRNTQDRMLSPLFTWRSAVASKESRLTSTQRHVALTLSLHMNERGASCYPSIAQQADETGLGASTVREACRQLAAKGWLTRKVGGGNWATEYAAKIPEWYVEELTPPAPGEGGQIVTPPALGGVHASSRRGPRQQPVGTSPTPGDQDVIQDDSKDAIQDVGESTELMPPGEVTQVMRKRDRLWDLFDEELGPVTNATERGRRNAALKAICQSLGIKNGTEAGDVHVAAVKMRLAEAEQRWSGEAQVTEMAIAANWRDLGKTRAGRGLSTEQILNLDLGGLFGDDEASTDPGGGDQRQLAPGADPG